MKRLRLFIALLGTASWLTASTVPDGVIDAAKRKDAAAVRALLERKADVNASAPDGTTALHWAAHWDDIETAGLLIRSGATVKAANRYGVTPLTLACTNGDAAMIELLLKAGADPNTATPEGETVLMTASKTGKLDAIRVLLANGAEVNKKEAWRGQTALMWAAAEGNLAAVERLIEQGADKNTRSNTGFTPFLFAVREGRIDVARLLLKSGANVDEVLPPRVRRKTGAGEISSPEGNYSALDLAISNGHFELAAMLLDAGANPNAVGPGWTPLHTITWVRKPGTGTNDPAPEGSGNIDSLEIVKRLAAHGANLNARMTKRTNFGSSALNMTGATPFLMAARTGDAELMRLLAKLGADPSLTTNEKTTPLMAAAGVGTRSPGEDAGTETEALEAVKVALELGNDVNAVDAKGETAMHGTAYKQFPAVARFLIDHGAKIEIWNQKNKYGWTPLRIAVGVHRTGNFRTSEPTAAVLRSAMQAAGVSTAVEPEVYSGRVPYKE
jgi:ankyrin repeat protein